MKTGDIQYHRGIYNLAKILENDNKYYTLENKDLLDTNDLFTERIKIEKRNIFNSDTLYFDHYLRFRTESNWRRCKKTGLAKTQVNNVFHGDISETIGLKQLNNKGKPFEHPKHFIITQFIKDNKILIVDIFKGFVIRNKEARICFINEHKLFK